MSPHNMPADIGLYDNHPLSPFCEEAPEVEDYEEPRCWACDQLEEDCECEDGFDPMDGEI